MDMSSVEARLSDAPVVKLMKITKQELDQLLIYDPLTGDLTWKSRGPEIIPDHGARKTWNARFRGRHAGVYDPKTGHTRVMVRRRNMYSRRIVYIMMTGKEPSGRLSHADGDTTNIRWGNIVVAGENREDVDAEIGLLSLEEKARKARDVARASAERQSAAKVIAAAPKSPGITYDHYERQWRARIGIGMAAIPVGLFPTQAEAITARAAEIVRLEIVE